MRDGDRRTLSRRRLLATTAGLGVSAAGLPGAGMATEPAGGTVRWSLDVGAAVDSSPTVVAGTVFVGGGDTLYALDGATGGLVWSAGVGGPVSAPAVSGDTVFVGTGDNGGVHALSTATGERRWSFEPDAGSFTTPAVSDGTVLVGNSQGDRVDVLLAADGEHLGAVEFGGFESIFSSVTRTGETAVFGTTSFGPGGNGAVYAYGVAADEIDWTASLTSGVQGSSPTVAGGRVFVGTNIGRLYALSADTGEQEWVSGIHNSPESSPTVADDRVFVGGPDGLSALSTATGTVDWSVETDGPVHSSPTVAGDRVFVGGPGGLHALSTAGERIWTVETDARVDSSPTVVDGTVFVGAGEEVHAVDAGLDGSSRGSRVTLGTLGHHDQAGREPTAVIAVDQHDPGSEGRVTLTARASGAIDSYAWDLTGNGETDATGRTVTPELDTGRHEVAVTVTGPAGETTARAPVSVPPAGGWRFDTGAAVETGPTVVDGLVYTATAGGVCAVTTAGDRAWQAELDDPRSPTVVDGRVFVGDDSGLTALSAETGAVVWTADTGPATSPTVAGGRVFAGTPTGLAAFSAAGERVWTVETDGPVEAAPTVARETALVVDRTGTVAALAVESGGELWTATGSSGPGVSPTVAGDRVFVGRADGLSALALDSGTREWHAEVGARTPPTAAGDRVFVGGPDGLSALSIATGERAWLADTDGPHSSPTVAGDRVFVGGVGGLSVLDVETGALLWGFGTDGRAGPPTVADGRVYLGADGLYALPATVDGSSVDSRAQLGTLGHPGDWRRADQQTGDADGGSASDDPGDEFGPGLGVGAAVAALGGLWALARRRSGQSSAK